MSWSSGPNLSYVRLIPPTRDALKRIIEHSNVTFPDKLKIIGKYLKSPGTEDGFLKKGIMSTQPELPGTFRAVLVEQAMKSMDPAVLIEMIALILQQASDQLGKPDFIRIVCSCVRYLLELKQTFADAMALIVKHTWIKSLHEAAEVFNEFLNAPLADPTAQVAALDDKQREMFQNLAYAFLLCELGMTEEDKTQPQQKTKGGLLSLFR